MTVARNQAHPSPGVTRDVHDELVRQRSEKRRQAGTVSPVQFHKDLLVGDDWSTAFLERISRGVSMHHFDAPPKTALDIGCGSGLWAIDAAKQWPDAKIVGFDLRKIQPDLAQTNLGIEYRDLAQRIEWVHGNFLDPLPFESNHFDLVRICCIGLEVPEDSWQELLEECSRVLKHGGTLEVIEEDLLFPAGRTRKDEPPKTTTVSIRRPSSDRMRSDSMASKLATQTSTTVQSTHSSSSGSDIIFTTEHMSQTSSIDTYASSSSSRLEPGPDLYLQDHARLKAAWEEMLDRRFLTHKLLTVIPFYLSSAFSNILVHPTLYVLLPPPSCVRDPLMEQREVDWEGDSLDQWLEDMRAYMVRIHGDPEHHKSPSSAALKARPMAAVIANWNTLHLGRQMGLISACKEAIWEAYRSLESGERDEAAAPESPKDDLREEFERDWEHWEEDMKDRMGIREHLQDFLDWKDPDRVNARPGSYRSRRSGQSQTQSKKSFDVAKIENDPDSAAICRAMRGFMAWKA